MSETIQSTALLTRRPISPSRDFGARPYVSGKFISIGEEKFYIRGVTYGTFRPDVSGDHFPDRSVVEQDFAAMAANGLNAARVYTTPPRWLLDVAQQNGLHVMVGLPWEQHIAFLDNKERAKNIVVGIRSAVRDCAGHPAVLCYAIGNEIPASIVRFYGGQRVSRFLRRLYRAVKAEDPDGLVTYVNFPSTEYLDLPFLDFVCFNVYLEEKSKLQAYLARLQNLAGERPLVMAEIGLDSLRNGQTTQAQSLDWQIRTVFASGCGGAFVFAWTDEWYRGGFDIEDWDFGLTDRSRQPKTALSVASKAFEEVPLSSDLQWPRMSVVVCTLNGMRTIRDCFEALQKLEYPDMEVIVVSDGSHDGTVALAHGYGFRVITGTNHGLSAARNTGMEAATGEIVAYIDDDASPDPHWLTYLAYGFMTTDHAGIGGPNIAPAGSGLVADCVANAPGGPQHVLISDLEAEHIPGCNMAFRKECLEAVRGFDTQFRIAGDDVDLCWKLQQRGWSLGFSPAAMVWHHRRDSVRLYWKQQKNYGKAEAMLERKWPEKYNLAGHAKWAGRVYGKGHTIGLDSLRSRIYQGVWGSASFQRLYQPGPNLLGSLPLMPEWYLVNAALAAVSALGVLWWPLLLALPLLLLAMGLPLIQVLASAARAEFSSKPQTLAMRMKLRSLTALLHVIQPMARLSGRLGFGLTPWRIHPIGTFRNPRSHTLTVWSEVWRAPEERLKALRNYLVVDGACPQLGNVFDSWDIEVAGGLLGAVRILLATEEHGAGKQLSRFRLWPRTHPLARTLILLFVVLATLAAVDQAWAASAVLAGVAFLGGLKVLLQCGAAMGAATGAIQELEMSENCADRQAETSSHHAQV